ncbi:MAG: LysR family transcriptional regulator [Burkholderiales bacterium]|nr:LysR family transcriptional regulator [Burkholderiales bacterium]
MNLTHRHVEVFRALMLTGSVTRAAELLHSSQPTVSRELARLEQVLQMNLFDRVRGRLRPTVRALALREEVERSFIGLERIAATAGSLRHFAEGRLSVACLPALAHALLPEATRRFLARHAQASVTITALESPLLESRLTEQGFDLGLTEQPEAPAGTTRLPLLQVDEVAVLPAGHPLLARRVLRPQDFAGQPFVSLAPEDPYRQQLDALFAQHRVQRVLALEAGSAVTVCALVRQGLGVAIVNPLTALELAGPDLQMRALSVRVPFHVGLVLPELRAPSPLREPFVAALREAAAAVRVRLAGRRRAAR